MIVDLVMAVTADEVNGFVYWTDALSPIRHVRRARLDGSNQVDVYSSKLSCVTDQMVWCVLFYKTLVGV